MSTPLEIVVTGDVSAAQSGLQVVQGELGKTVLSSKSAGQAFDEMNAKMQNFRRAAQNSMNPEYVAIYNRKVQELQASMKVLAAQADAEALSTENASVAMSKMTAVTGGATIGQKRLASAIARSTDPYQIAAREINNFSRRLLYMAGAEVMQLAITAFMELAPYVEEFFTGLNKSSEASKLAAANLANLNEVMADANKHAGEQITDLQILYKTATDVNLSMKDRLAAVKELQKEFPDFFGNIKAETILNGDAKKSYDELTQSIIANSMAKAAKDKIDALNAQKLQAIENNAKIVGTVTKQVAAPKSNIYLPNYGYVGKNEEALINTPQDQNNALISNANVKINEQNQTIKAIDNQIDFLVKFAHLPKLAKVIEDGDKTKEKKGKKTNPFEISLKELEDNYKQAQALLVQQYDANATDSKKNTTAVNDLLLKAEQDFLEKKLELIKKYGKKEGDVDLEIAKNNKALVANQIAFRIDQINSLPKVENAPKINFEKATDSKINPKVDFQFSDTIKKNIEAQKEMQELLENTANLLDKTVGPAFDNLFSGILEGSKNAFKAFGDSIKQMLIQLAAAVLKAALFAAILSVISGGSSTVAGAAGGGKSFMDLFSGSMKNLFGFSKGGEVKGFAGGGAISGAGTTTSDSILARVSRGEYVMNASAVSKFGASFFDGLNSGLLPRFSSGGPVGSNSIVASGNNIFIPEVTLKGQDLIIAFNRANQRASRNG